MLINRKSPIEERSVQVAPLPITPSVSVSWSGVAAWATAWFAPATGLLLCVAWLAVVLGAPAHLPLYWASWLTFAGLLIAPGYLLADLLVRKLDLDWPERMALAFPVGMAVLSAPGMAALLQHWRIDGLAQAWVWVSLAVVVGWGLSWLWKSPSRTAQTGLPWSWDERVLLLLIVAACFVITPVLNQQKIDGDTFAVGSFTADAMAGLPLNQAEPLFGTELGPGVRMAFNQSLPMIYLWSYWSGIDPMILMGSATRAMFAFWALLATYVLGKSAGVGVGGSLNGRRIGLLAVAVQLLIYMAAPFLRGDNVSLFFFERIAADKFLVPATMLPIAFGLAIRFIRLGERPIWMVGALTALAVSAIHPLVAAMMALGLGAFGAVHLLTRMRDASAYRRVGGLAALVAIVMVLPLTQLALARGEDPLAASFPRTLEGWDVSYRWVPVLPYVNVPTLDVHGPLPDLSQLDAAEAMTATDPFLIWRFAVNMDRRRLVLFDLDRYISDPNIFLEPPYLLALLLLPFLFRGIRRSLGAQFAVASSAAILFVMYNPLVTPLLGGLVMPWILWRFVWMFPYALIIALALAQGLNWLGATVAGLSPSALEKMGSARLGLAARRARRFQRYAPVALILLVGLAAAPTIGRNLQTLQERAGFPYYFPQPMPLLERLDAETRATGPATVMADADLSVTIPAYVAQANIVAHRVPTTSEVFPAHLQAKALQRLIDQDAFYRARYLTADSAAILRKYDTRFVVASGGSNLDLQLRLSPVWFTSLFEDQSYALYAVTDAFHTQADNSNLIQANTALAQRRWSEAELLYHAELGRNSNQSAAWAGLAEIAHARGEFGDAIPYLEHGIAAVTAATGSGTPTIHDRAGRAELAALYFRLGQFLGDKGRLSESILAYEAAAQLAPAAARVHVAWGDACLRLARMECAEAAFATGIAQHNLPDQASYTVTLADLWRQRGYLNRAIALYETVAGGESNHGRRIHQLILAGAYQEAGRYAEAEALLDVLRSRELYSPDLLRMSANLYAEQGRIEEAIAAYARAIWLLELSGRESTQTRLALASTLLDPNSRWTRTGEAQTQLNWILRIEPTNAIAHSLQGDLHTRLFRGQDALASYATAFRLDPTSVPVYFALSNQYRRLGGAPTHVSDLLQAALRANPNEATLALALGDQLQRRSDMSGAVESYLSALDLFEQRAATGRLNPRITGGSRAYAYVQLAAVHEELGQVERAMNFYGAAVAGAPDAAWALVAYGDALRRQNQAGQAEDAYRQALAVDATFIPAYLGLADLQSARGLAAEASALRHEALGIAFVSLVQPTAWSGFGFDWASPHTEWVNGSFSSDRFGELVVNGTLDANGLREEQMVEFALAALRAGDVRLEPDAGSVVLSLLGRLAVSTDQADAIFELYREALAQGEREGWYPTALAQYHKGMGDLYLVRNRPEAAVGAYGKAIALDEGRLQARLGLVNALSSAGHWTAATTELEAMLAAEPGVAQVRLALAQQYLQSARTEDAQALLAETVAATPGNIQSRVTLAQLHQALGEWETAEDIYRQIITSTPGAVDAMTPYGALLLEQARDAEAADVLAAANEVDRANLWVHLLSATLAQRMGDTQAASEWLANAGQLSDPSGANWVAVADLYGRFALNQEGLRFLETATARHPEQVELVLRQARTQRILGQSHEAMASLLAAANLDLSDARLTAELAEVYLAQGRRQSAATAYRQAIVLDPGQANYVLRLAELYSLLGDEAQAETVLQQGLARVTEPATLYAALSEQHIRRGEMAEAHALLSQAIAKLGDAPVLVVGMGVLLEAQSLRSLGPSDSPERWYQEALARDGTQPEIHAALAEHYLRRGRADQALTHYREALALAPTRARYHLGLGAAQAAHNNLAAAESAYRQAIRLEPGLLDAYYQMVELYSAQRNWDAARGVFVQAKQVAPANGDVHVRYAAFLLARGETQLGMELLRKAATIAPTGRTLIARAGVYAKLGRTDDAIVDLQQAIAWEPGNVDAHIALGDVLRDFGNIQAASESYANAVRLNPGLGFGRLRVTRGR